MFPRGRKGLNFRKDGLCYFRIWLITQTCGSFRVTFPIIILFRPFAFDSILALFEANAFVNALITRLEMSCPSRLTAELISKRFFRFRQLQFSASIKLGQCWYLYFGFSVIQVALGMTILLDDDHLSKAVVAWLKLTSAAALGLIKQRIFICSLHWNERKVSGAVIIFLGERVRGGKHIFITTRRTFRLAPIRNVSQN